jgi:uncharacterized Zn-binding protein involved in type VI secretion
MPAAARQTDMIKQDAPHCHAPIHPPAPVPTPLAHPALPLTIVSATVPTVLINSLPAAVMGSMSTPCILPSCIPAGPGMIAKGSATVLIGKRPAARANDMAAFSTCVAPIPAPVGKVMPPCSPTVMIGG